MRLADFMSGWTGGNGWIARTDDGGRSWTKQWEDGTTVKQLFALNKNLAWAALDSGDLLRTADGGNSWLKTGTVPNASFLHFVSATEAFSGDSHTTDGGLTWKKFRLPANIVGDAYFHDAKNGWVVAFKGGKFIFMRTTDGGKTWVNLPCRVSRLRPSVHRRSRRRPHLVDQHRQHATFRPLHILGRLGYLEQDFYV